jgi:prepilin signal peptidase PulO-like enzyme (type II secretory pathway)
LPRRETIVSGRSKCPHCGRQIRAWENIPVVSYLALRARCPGCGEKISVRYPLIELVTGALFGLSAWKFGWSAETFAYAGFFWVLVVLSVIDLELKLLYSRVILWGLVSGVAALVVVSVIDGAYGEFRTDTVLAAVMVVAVNLVMGWPDTSRTAPDGSGPDGSGPNDPGAEDLTTETVSSEAEEQEPKANGRMIRMFRYGGYLALILWIALLVFGFADGLQARLTGALLGAAVFSGLFFAIYLIYPRGMGGGDVRLALLLGAFVGYLGAPGLVLAAIFSSIVAGALVSIVALLVGGNRKTQIPFGPSLAVGAAVAVFVGQRIVDAYGGNF